MLSLMPNTIFVDFPKRGHSRKFYIRLPFCFWLLFLLGFRVLNASVDVSADSTSNIVLWAPKSWLFFCDLKLIISLPSRSMWYSDEQMKTLSVRSRKHACTVVTPSSVTRTFWTWIPGTAHGPLVCEHLMEVCCMWFQRLAHGIRGGVCLEEIKGTWSKVGAAHSYQPRKVI